MMGEQLASKYLIDRGYHILQKNFRTRFGEIDIIAQKQRTVIFVEVKARTSDIKGKPYMSVTPRKIAHLKRAIYSFILKNNLSDHKLRFDVISIEFTENHVPQIRHFESVDLLV